MAEILSRVLSRKVRRVDLPWRLFLKAARTANVGAFLVGNLRYYVEDHKQGAFALGVPTNDVLEVTPRISKQLHDVTPPGRKPRETSPIGYARLLILCVLRWFPDTTRSGIGDAVVDAGLSLDTVMRTRIMLTDVLQGEAAARAHGEVYSPNTFVQRIRYGAC